jgi:hypothetical protein
MVTKIESDKNFGSTNKDLTSLLIMRKIFMQEKDDHPADGENTIVFVQKLIAADFFAIDDSFWQKLNKGYTANGRELPKNIYDKLRLEAYLRAISLAEDEIDPSQLNNYNKLAFEAGFVDFPITKLFEEERFIKSKVCSRWWADGVDKKERLFRYDNQGNKGLRIAQGGDDGEDSYETLKTFKIRVLGDVWGKENIKIQKHWNREEQSHPVKIDRYGH